jgi:hypothetical protein
MPPGEITMLFWIKVAFWIAAAICLWRFYREINAVASTGKPVVALHMRRPSLPPTAHES